MDKNKLAKAVVAILLATPLLSIVYWVISELSFSYENYSDLFDDLLVAATTISICVLIFIYLYPRILKKN